MTHLPTFKYKALVKKQIAKIWKNLKSCLRPHNQFWSQTRGAYQILVPLVERSKLWQFTQGPWFWTRKRKERKNKKKKVLPCNARGISMVCIAAICFTAHRALLSRGSRSALDRVHLFYVFQNFFTLHRQWGPRLRHTLSNGHWIAARCTSSVPKGSCVHF